MTDHSYPTEHAAAAGRFRFQQRTWATFAGALLLLFVLYAGSYYQLSRRGMEEAKMYNMHGFLYEPVADVLAKEDLSRHHTLAALYAPLNWLDRLLLGSQGPVRCILWGLSK